MTKKAYIAFVYGTAEDKNKILVLAGRKSVSEFLKKMVNDRYAELYGETPPADLLTEDHKIEQ